jgi:chromosome segregation ATPase
MDEQARRLSNQLVEADQAISGLTDRAEQKLGERITAAQAQTERMDEQARRLSDRLIEADQAISELTERADRQARELESRVTGAAAVLEHITRVRAEIHETLGSQAMRDLENLRAAIQAATDAAASQRRTLEDTVAAAEGRQAALEQSNGQAAERTAGLQEVVQQATALAASLNQTTEAVVAVHDQVRQTADEARGLGEALAATLATGRQESARLEQIIAQASAHAASASKAACLAEQATTQLACTQAEAEQVTANCAAKLTALTGRLDEAGRQSRKLETMLNRGPQIGEQVAEQIKITMQLKRDLEKAARRLIRERQLAEVSIDHLHSLRLEQVQLAGAAMTAECRMEVIGDRPARAAGRIGRDSIDVLESIRRAVSGPEPPVGIAAGQLRGNTEFGQTAVGTIQDGR